MGWLWLVGSIKLYVSFAEYRLFYRALLQKRPIIVRSLLIVATPYPHLHLHLCPLYPRLHLHLYPCPRRSVYVYIQICRFIYYVCGIGACRLLCLTSAARCRRQTRPPHLTTRLPSQSRRWICTCICMYIYMYIHIYIRVYIYIYVYVV